MRNFLSFINVWRGLCVAGGSWLRAGYGADAFLFYHVGEIV